MVQPPESRNKGCTTALSALALVVMRTAAAGSARVHLLGLVTEEALEDVDIWDAVADEVGDLMAVGKGDEVGVLMAVGRGDAVGALDGAATVATAAAVTVAGGGRGVMDTRAEGAELNPQIMCRRGRLSQILQWFCGGKPQIV